MTLLPEDNLLDILLGLMCLLIFHLVSRLIPLAFLFVSLQSWNLSLPGHFYNLRGWWLKASIKGLRVCLL